MEDRIGKIEKAIFDLQEIDNKLNAYASMFAGEVARKGDTAGLSIMMYEEEKHGKYIYHVLFIEVDKDNIENYIDILENLSGGENPLELLNDLVDQKIVSNYTFVNAKYLNDEVLGKIENIMEDNVMCAYLSNF